MTYVEFNRKPKLLRACATGDDKTARTFLAAVPLAAAVILRT